MITSVQFLQILECKRTMNTGCARSYFLRISSSATTRKALSHIVHSCCSDTTSSLLHPPQREEVTSNVISPFKALSLDRLLSTQCEKIWKPLSKQASCLGVNTRLPMPVLWEVAILELGSQIIWNVTHALTRTQSTIWLPCCIACEHRAVQLYLSTVSDSMQLTERDEMCEHLKEL